MLTWLLALESHFPLRTKFVYACRGRSWLDWRHWAIITAIMANRVLPAALGLWLAGTAIKAWGSQRLSLSLLLAFEPRFGGVLPGGGCCHADSLSDRRHFSLQSRVCAERDVLGAACNLRWSAHISHQQNGLPTRHFVGTL